MSPSDHTHHHTADTRHAPGHPETDCAANGRLMTAVIVIGIVAIIFMNRTLEDWLASAILGGIAMLIIVALVGTRHSSRPRPTAAVRHVR